MKVKKVTRKKQQVDFPDIDTDFGSNVTTGKDKDDIVNYLIDKYGRDNVAAVGNRLEYSPKSVLRDLGQVYEVPASDTFKCTKKYNDALDVEGNIRTNEESRNFFKKYPELKSKVDTIVGTISSLGVHAGGVVITDKRFSLKKYCALQRPNEDGRVATLWTKSELQPIGLVKYDLLGLTTAGQIHLVKEMIGFDPYDDFPEDEEVYRNIVLPVYHKNIFQFESQLGRKAFEDLKPMNIMELANASSIIRIVGSPQGRDLFETYKDHVAHVQMGDTEYWKEKIREEILEDKNYDIMVDVLSDSYGVLIYQEQLCNLVRSVSGGRRTFTDGNKVRKILEKHSTKYGDIENLQGNPDALKKWHDAFMIILNEYFLPYLGKDGLNSPDKDLQNFLKFKLDSNNNLPTPKFGIIKWLMASMSYLFSKLHAIGYSINSYNAMYLKHYHPLEFWVGSLIYEQNDLMRVKEYISAIHLETDIEVLPPNLNKSDLVFSISDGNIRYGLGGIMNVGESAKVIIAERKRHGEFKNIKDFINRVPKEARNKRVLEGLLYSSAFSDFGSIEKVHNALLKEGLNINDELVTGKNELAILEAKYLGHSLTNIHPLVENAGAYIPITAFENGDTFDTAVYIIDLKNKVTKNNKNYVMFKCQCLNSFEQFNVFDWTNNQMAFKKGTFEVFHINKGNDFFSLRMSNSYNGADKKKKTFYGKDIKKRLRTSLVTN